MWKIFIDHHVAEIKSSKGANYFAHLCSISPEAPVYIIISNKSNIDLI